MSVSDPAHRCGRTNSDLCHGQYLGRFHVNCQSRARPSPSRYLLDLVGSAASLIWPYSNLS